MFYFTKFFFKFNFLSCFLLLLLLLPLVGLFARVALLSGSALAPSAIVRDAENNARQLAKQLNCPVYVSVDFGYHFPPSTPAPTSRPFTSTFYLVIIIYSIYIDGLVIMKRENVSTSFFSILVIYRSLLLLLFADVFFFVRLIIDQLSIVCFVSLVMNRSGIFFFGFLDKKNQKSKRKNVTHISMRWQ